MKNTKTNRGKFTPLQKKIILAQSASADGDPAVAITAIDEARLLTPSAAVCKLLEKARDEFDYGNLACGETLLDLALAESKLTCTPAVEAVKPVETRLEDEASGDYISGPYPDKDCGGNFFIIHGWRECGGMRGKHQCRIADVFEGKAAADLYASAPALLAALETLCDETRQDSGNYPLNTTYKNARAAIASARGESGQTCPHCGLTGQLPDSLKCDDCGKDLPARYAAESHGQ